MSVRTMAEPKSAPPSSFTPVRARTLQRCGSSHCPPGQCGTGKKKKGEGLQRYAAGPTGATAAPPIVGEVLRASGRPLDPATRAFMEPRFGHDFSRVRVHADARAAESARAVNALAYTVGRDVVFGAGRYAPATTSGRRLVAHELTHVVQQQSGGTLESRLVVQPARNASEREADQVASQAANGSMTSSGVPIVHAMVNEGIQRYSYGRDAGPVFADGVRYVEVPQDHRDRVQAALDIVSRVVHNPRDYPECPRFFEVNCPGGSATAIFDAYNRPVIWFQEGPNPNGELASTDRLGGENIAYTDQSYIVGKWAIAASFIHEFIHVCGQGDHDIGDRAKHACGRLPNI